MENNRLFLVVFVAISLLAATTFLATPKQSRGEEKQRLQTPNTISPTSTPKPLPAEKTILNDYWIVQTFNNCGPASLSMALSYFDIQKSQEELGVALRPYQNADGDNDDKSVSLEELAKKAREYGLLTYHRPNGNITILKQFIAQDIPVISRTWLHVNEDIGHYRVVKGYNENNQTIIQDDSYEGANLSFSYDNFNTMWEKYDYEYLVLVPKEKKAFAESILGRNLDEKFAWQEAVKNNEAKLAKNPSDIYTRFNLSVVYYHVGEYKKSVEEFEKVQYQLPLRTLWYQIEPIQAYLALNQHEKVFEWTDYIINTQNRAASELYILRGESYKKQGNKEAARQEFENAVYYNQNLQEANDAFAFL